MKTHIMIKSWQLAPVLLALVFFSCTSSHEEEEKPNFLFILADDFGYHDLSCMGSEYYETPNIDRISNEGMTFTDGYATCQVCSPSRASIMTGQFPARHGITDWIGAPAGEDGEGQGDLTNYCLRSMNTTCPIKAPPFPKP